MRRLRSRVGVLPLPELLDDVLERSGYRAMLADGTEEGEERWANLLELREVTTRYDDLSAEDALDRLLEETALVADQDSYQSDADMLSLITLHAAKGLEFEVVFIAGLEESLFPTGRAVEAEGGFNPDPRPMEEERRLAYVGHDPGAARGCTCPTPGSARRAAARHELDGRAVAVPARDPGRADERPAPRCPRRTEGDDYDAPGRPQPRVRPRRDAVRARRSGPAAAPSGRGAAGPARRAPASCSGRRATSPRGATRSPRARDPARSGGGSSRPGTTAGDRADGGGRRRGRGRGEAAAQRRAG